MSDGMKIRLMSNDPPGVPPRVPGQHLWMVFGGWRVRPQAEGDVILDTENLLTLAGPACYWCEELHTPELESSPCAATEEQVRERNL